MRFEAVCAFFFFLDRYFIAVEDNKIIALNVPER